MNTFFKALLLVTILIVGLVNNPVSGADVTPSLIIKSDCKNGYAEGICPEGKYCKPLDLDGGEGPGICSVKLYIVLVVALVISSCSAKFTGFIEFDGLSETDVQHSNMSVCEYCNRVVAFWDKHSPPETTPEKLAANIKGVICKDVLPGSIDKQLCKAMAGKEDVFAKAYFDHQKDDKINPCKVTHIC